MILYYKRALIMRALVIYGGIAKNYYAKKELLGINEIQNNLKNNYDEVIEFGYEIILDNKFRYIPKMVYNHLRLLDKHGDWIQFATCKRTRTELRQGFKQLIEALQEKGYVVDVIAHSLGTWGCLGTPVSVNNLHLFGSPYSSKSFITRNTVRNELKSCPYLIKAKNLVYVWNKDDFVSGHLPKLDILSNVSKFNQVFEKGHGHSFKDYAKIIYTTYPNLLNQ